MVEKFDSDYKLIEEATEVLKYLNSMNNTHNEKVIMGIVTDTHKPNELPLSECQKIGKIKFCKFLKNKITKYFEPTDSRLTLSSDIGFTKNHNLKGFLNNAINKISNNISIDDIIFVTELVDHIIAAKSLGIKTFHYNPQIHSSNDDDTINKLLI